MAKYGLFALSHGPYQEFEGDFMQMDGEYVRILKYDANGIGQIVAAVRLDKGQSVKLIG